MQIVVHSLLTIVTALPLYAQTPCPATQTITELKAAADGNAKAQSALARAYEDGCGIPQNNEEAFKWAKKAAEQGDAEAEDQLAGLYRLGHGIAKDPVTAVQWYRKAARQGFAPAMYNLGTAYFNGDGLVINDVSAYARMLAAGGSGYPNIPEAISHIELRPKDIAVAYLRLGTMYELGDLPQNFDVAMKWYKASANLQNPAAQVKIANLYFEGKGASQDYGQGLAACETALKQHYAPAMVCMGYASEKGWGLNRTQPAKILAT